MDRVRPIAAEPEHLAEVLRGWRDAMRSAPRELTTTFVSLLAFGHPEMPSSMQIEICWAAPDSAAAEAAVAPLLALPGVKEHKLAASTYREILVENPGPPPGISIVDLNGFTGELTDARRRDRASTDPPVACSCSAARRSSRGCGGTTALPGGAQRGADRRGRVPATGQLDGTEERIRGQWATIGAGRVRQLHRTARRLDVIYSPETLDWLRSDQTRTGLEGAFRRNQPISVSRCRRSGCASNHSATYQHMGTTRRAECRRCRPSRTRRPRRPTPRLRYCGWVCGGRRSSCR